VHKSGGGEEAVSRIKDIEVDLVLAVLRLSTCSGTTICNGMLKGVSGVVKRRVTLGEMLVAGAQVMGADEISIGLDSAATFDIPKFLSNACHVMGQTILVALLQLASEVLNLFDGIIVLLLAEGKIIYLGPKEKVQE
jgi:ABC-type multidrug transport system ATPase subunit